VLDGSATAMHFNDTHFEGHFIHFSKIPKDNRPHLRLSIAFSQALVV